MRSQLSVKLVQFLSLTLLFTFAVQAQAISTGALMQGIPSLASMLKEVTPAVSAFE